MKAKELVVSPFSSIVGCGIWDGEKHLILVPNNFGKEETERLAKIVLWALTSTPNRLRAVAVPEPAAPPTLYCDVCDTELQRESCDRVRPCVKCLKAEPAAQQESRKEWLQVRQICSSLYQDVPVRISQDKLTQIRHIADKVLAQAEPAPTPSRCIKCEKDLTSARQVMNKHCDSCLGIAWAEASALGTKEE